MDFYRIFVESGTPGYFLRDENEDINGYEFRVVDDIQSAHKFTPKASARERAARLRARGVRCRIVNRYGDAVE